MKTRMTMSEQIESTLSNNSWGVIAFGWIAWILANAGVDPRTIAPVIKIMSDITVYLGFVLAVLSVLVKGKEFYKLYIEPYIKKGKRRAPRGRKTP